MKIIPIYASAGITGFESPAAEYKQSPLCLDDLLIEHPSATFIGQAKGDSMQGVGIFDGDILVVDRQLTVKNNDVIVGCYNGEFVCKIIDTHNQLLLSANTDYEPALITASEMFTIEGVVSRSIRCHRPAKFL
ncbi:LexA family protein [Shewanella sp. 10N.286.51.B2]|uniref:LexA family protein n=1 Tax=Shewanella sp. 10N.286.51.B2 TaxID=3229707 RepID=UPI00354B4BEB